ncbi:hypothetical protein [Bradyrhizobium sp. USDA 223]|uniref:hypothetical protein n=1 Tax=Bradyrhizobium sp. USDA 223 TaxID=3156306 RepID=UPI0038337E75
MAYALLKDGEKMSRTFPTNEEALEKADEAGLVEPSLAMMRTWTGRRSSRRPDQRQGNRI